MPDMTANMSSWLAGRYPYMLCQRAPSCSQHPASVGSNVDMSKPLARAGAEGCDGGGGGGGLRSSYRDCTGRGGLWDRLNTEAGAGAGAGGGGPGGGGPPLATPPDVSCWSAVSCVRSKEGNPEGAGAVGGAAAVGCDLLNGVSISRSQRQQDQVGRFGTHAVL